MTHARRRKFLVKSAWRWLRVTFDYVEYQRTGDSVEFF